MLFCCLYVSKGVSIDSKVCWKIPIFKSIHFETDDFYGGECQLVLILSE